MSNKQKKSNIEKVRDIKPKKRKNLSQNEIKEKYPHFRFYKKSKHPALIIGEQVNQGKDEFNFRKVTHSEREGRHINEKVEPNPNPKDKKPMYIVKRVRHDEKTNFSEWKYNWKYNQKKK